MVIVVHTVHHVGHSVCAVVGVGDCCGDGDGDPGFAHHHGSPTTLLHQIGHPVIVVIDVNYVGDSVAVGIETKILRRIQSIKVVVGGIVHRVARRVGLHGRGHTVGIHGIDRKRICRRHVCGGTGLKCIPGSVPIAIQIQVVQPSVPVGVFRAGRPRE